MKLIDAEELMAKVNYVKYLRKRKAQRLCDECREVEAIPIEWILKKAIDTDEQGAFTTAYLILIEEWEKENGKKD